MPKTIHAVFIGINTYSNKPLRGCVNDAIDAHSFFEELARSNENLHYQPNFYLAYNETDKSILNKFAIDLNKNQAPTRDNIIASFSHFDAAKEGDICLFFYSGHGSFTDAPKEFWHMKSAKQVETIVCVDSRTTDGKDIVDKELGYSIWKTMKDKKEVTFLAIMDSCHSGDNTRDANSQFTTKEDTPNSNNNQLSDYLGFEAGGNEFYQYTAKDRINVPFGSHVHLAAAREDESAKELTIDGQRRGVFTYALFKTLRNGGLSYSYEELMERVGVIVKNRIDRQLPQVTAFGAITADQQFLSDDIKPITKTYPIYFSEKKYVWKMNAGQIQGIQPSVGIRKTIVQIIDKTGATITSGKVIKTGVTESVLKLEKNIDHKADYLARITQMAAPNLAVELSADLTEEQKTNFRQEASSYSYFKFKDGDEASHIVKPLYEATELTGFILTKKDSEIPLFKRKLSVQGLLSSIDTVAKWFSTTEMANADTEIKRSDLNIKIEIIEGQEISPENIDHLPSNQSLDDPAVIHLKYINDLQPAIRVKIHCPNKAYFVSVLYLGSQYNIEHFLKHSPKIAPSGAGETLKFNVESNEYNTIPILFNKDYHRNNITNVTDYLKIFISTQPFDLSKYVQEGLELDFRGDEDKGIGKGGPGFSKKSLEAESFEDWTAITIPINIEYPLQSVRLDNEAVHIGDLTIQGPEGFSAQITAASKKHVEQMLKVVSKSVDDTAELTATLLPPASLWGNSGAGAAPLSRGSQSDSDTQLSILEFEDIKGEPSKEKPIRIQTQGTEEDEVIISFAYDEESGLYIPLGFSDDVGVIEIGKLPRPTSGKIFEDGDINKKSLGGSVKLFFKKVFGKPFIADLQLNHLMECKYSATNGVSKSELVADSLNNPEVKEILLLTHGIIGDTEGQVECFFKRTSLYKHFDVVLTFDYENLGTPIEETALDLKKKLIAAGLFKIDAPRLTVIAHSMGGLVTRSLVEQAKGRGILKKLIQVGTPNSGSEINEFRKSLFDLMAHALNGPAHLKIFLTPLAFLLKKLSKKAFTTLTQMAPDSPFLLGLNTGEIDINKYRLIAGNTSLLEVKHGEDDGFLKIWYEKIKQKGHYYALNFFVFGDANNDMAVRVARMQDLYEKNLNTDLKNVVFLVPSDHISYFSNAETIKHLKQLIIEDVVA